MTAPRSNCSLVNKSGGNSGDFDTAGANVSFGLIVVSVGRGSLLVSRFFFNIYFDEWERER